MSLQSFESGASAAVAEPVPFVELQSIQGYDQQIFTPVDEQDAQLGTEQFAPTTDATGVVKVAQDQTTEQQGGEAPLTLESVLQDIQKDYENGLFYSFRDQVPFFYPTLPGVIVYEEQGVPIEEQQPAIGE